PRDSLPQSGGSRTSGPHLFLANTLTRRRPSGLIIGKYSCKIDIWEACDGWTAPGVFAASGAARQPLALAARRAGARTAAGRPLQRQRPPDLRVPALLLAAAGLHPARRGHHRAGLPAHPG